jgi:hypothetical protein
LDERLLLLDLPPLLDREERLLLDPLFAERDSPLDDELPRDRDGRSESSPSDDPDERLPLDPLPLLDPLAARDSPPDERSVSLFADEPDDSPPPEPLEAERDSPDDEDSLPLPEPPPWLSMYLLV